MTNRDDPKPGRRGLGIAVGTLLLLATMTATAIADAPEIESGPTVSGTPHVGNTLRGEARWEGSPSWRWMRCDGVRLDGTCEWISGATARTYTVTPADHGRHLRVMLTVRHRDDHEWGISPPTAAVTSPPAPTPTPTPSPSPSPSPQPQPSPSPQAPVTVIPPPATPLATPPAPAVEVRDEQAARALRMMSPAPVVRIRGHLTRTGARITLLTVRAPRGARIALRCFGRGCPARRWARTASLTRIARFQSVLPGGTKLVVRVTKPGRIGKHTTVVIRRGAAPTRRDRCLVPGSSRPVACSRVAT